MTQSNYVLITILVCICAPGNPLASFNFFGGKSPGLVRYLGTILPAIMAVLVVYCLKESRTLAYPYGLPELYPLPWWWTPPLEEKYLASIALGNVVLHDAGTVGILMRL